MSDFSQTLVLGVLQGLTEFLPISSSAHLILLPIISGWQDHGMAFDIAFHFGTLIALVLYFKHEIKHMFKDWINSLVKGVMTPYAKLAWAIGFGTIPVGLFGLLGKSYIEGNLRSPFILGSTTLIFGICLGLASYFGRNSCNEYSIGVKHIVLVGIAQIFSLIPGASRSGVTMSAGMVLGLTKQAAARYSFLLGIPVICLATGLQFIQLLSINSPVNWELILFGTLVSGVTGYAAIHCFLQLLDKIGVYPFVIYRIILGVAIFAFLTNS